jgi:hypothetical protein
MSYAVVYFARAREVSVKAASWTRAMDKAANIAIKRERPFPIIIKDGDGHILHEIKG